MERYYDVAVVGAGPSGLAAAMTVKADCPQAKVLLLEKKEIPAKKLRASGNGRGNLSNEKCPSFDRVLEFFCEVGIAVRVDERGLVYPYSEEAGAAAEALVRRAVGLGAELRTDSEVKGVEADSDKGFRIFVCSGQGGGQDMSKPEEIYAGMVMIATGGKSFASYGSTGDGYGFARKLGHEVTPLVPALTAIEVSDDVRSLKGVRAKATATLFEEGEAVFSEEGEVQFREDSLSGICIMNMSSHLPLGVDESSRRQVLDRCMIKLNFVPDFDAVGLLRFLKAEREMEGMTAFGMLETLVKKPLALIMLRRAELKAQTPAAELGEEELLKMANQLRSFYLCPCGRKGWKEAQVTKGGVKLSYLNDETMESLIRPGLFFAGELVDYDGPCGGFNLHNAWLTGIKAGKAMAERI